MSIAPAVTDALSRAGPVSVRHVAACLANADLPVEVHALEAAIERAGWVPSSEVVNDTFALLRAGLDAGRGVAVVCGAGINCAGVLEDGTTVRFAAVGQISGDWGGGGHLWQEAMWWAARAEDGRGPDTALRTALPAHFGSGRTVVRPAPPTRPQRRSVPSSWFDLWPWLPQASVANPDAP